MIETDRFFPHVVAANPKLMPLPVYMKQTNQKVAVTCIARFPGWAKYSVTYGANRSEPEFKYFEILKSN